MNKHRRVVIVGTAHPYRGGGISTFNERLAKAFQDHGDEVSIYNFTLQYPRIFFPGKFQKTTEPAPENLRILNKVNSINPINWLLVGNELRKSKPDLVVFRYWLPFMAPCFGSIARIIHKNRHTRIVAITDNVIPHENKPLDKVFSRYFIKGMDGFVAMSRSVLEDLKSFDKNKKKIYNPHPLYDNYGEAIPKRMAQENLGWDPRRHHILFFGFVREYKGLDILIEAMSDERLKHGNYLVHVAGEFYTDPEQYARMAKNLGLEEKIIMPNKFIPNKDIVNYFCASDLIVQPYKTATQSGVTQVATHFNKPMVITNVGGLSEFVPDGKTGFVVEPEPGFIAEAIYKFFKNNYEESFAENINLEKKKYSWEKMISSIIQVSNQKND
ncbi:MAG: glycosyltransferase [Bacteroidota bacterium]|nr:glycosyltransferase [Bacteroidota bacterium]